MRRYLGSMRPVPVGPFGHRVVSAEGWDARACATDSSHGAATHVTQYREERGRRRSAIHTTEAFVCAECAQGFAAKHRVVMP